MSCYCGSKDCPECSPEAKKRWRNDDSNMGHESVPYKQVSRKTMAYSIVDEVEAKKRDGGSKALAPTEEMPAWATLTLQEIIKELIEVNVTAWKALPPAVQETMLSNPEKFRFYRGTKLPDLIFNGVRFHFETEGWRLHSVVGVVQ